MGTARADVRDGANFMGGKRVAAGCEVVLRRRRWGKILTGRKVVENDVVFMEVCGGGEV